jgi:AbrB family looped-hinge helix DNA binding protein
MRTTTDKAGRLVIPKSLRDQSGIAAGEVEIFLDGATIRIESVSVDELDEVDGILMLPTGGSGLDDEAVRELRLADQR